VEELTVRAAQNFDEFYAARLREPAATDALLVLSFDGKSVVQDRACARCGASGDFDDYWLFHVAKEHERTHASRYADLRGANVVLPGRQCIEEVDREYRLLAYGLEAGALVSPALDVETAATTEEHSGLEPEAPAVDVEACLAGSERPPDMSLDKAGNTSG
jgi:hypothetical protein